MAKRDSAIPCVFICPNYKTAGLPAGLMRPGAVICDSFEAAIPYLEIQPHEVLVGGNNAFETFKCASELAEKGHVAAAFWQPELQTVHTDVAIGLARKGGVAELLEAPPFVKIVFAPGAGGNTTRCEELVRRLQEIRERPVLTTRSFLASMGAEIEQLSELLIRAQGEVSRLRLVDSEIELVNRSNRELMRELLHRRITEEDLKRENELLGAQLSGVLKIEEPSRNNHGKVESGVSQMGTALRSKAAAGLRRLRTKSKSVD